MGWESRGKTGALYYYRSRRTADGTVVKEYCGRGGWARLAADAVTLSQAEPEAERLAIKSEAARLAEPNRLLADLVRATQLLLEAALFISGYHRPKNGKWRKRRGRESLRATATDNENPGRDPGSRRPGQPG